MSQTIHQTDAYPTDPYAESPLTPQEIREAPFPSSRLGRRGVDESEVRAFCERVASQMTRMLTQRTALEAEVRRLRERVIGTRADKGVAPDGAQVQAVNVLTMAQRTADRYVADAQEYSRELAQDAHLRHDEILREAQVRASMILDEAHATAQAAADRVLPAPTDGGAAAGSQREAEAELAYLRTFSHICRTHLRAYLESLSKSIEEWEKVEANGMMSGHGAALRPPAASLSGTDRGDPPFPRGYPPGGITPRGPGEADPAGAAGLAGRRFSMIMGSCPRIGRVANLPGDVRFGA